MAVLIWLLAKFMRADDGRAALDRKTNFGDRVLSLAGRSLGLVLEVVFPPFEWVLYGVESLSTASLRRMRKTAGDQPLFKMRQRERMNLVLRLLVLVPIMLFVLFPFYWVIITSFKTTPQIFERTSIFWPNPWTFDQYISLIQATPFLTWFRNTVIVALSSTAISVVLASLSAYALARLKFLGAGLLTTVLLITYLLPGTLLFIPLYQTLTDLGIINTYWALIVTYPTFLLPFATWVMMGYFRSIPVELEEAAMIDGASRLRAFWQHHPAAGRPGTALGDAVRFHQRLERVPVCLCVYHQRIRCRTLPIGLQSAGRGRYSSLGPVDGRLAADGDSGR